jgi:hypothetical protein
MMTSNQTPNESIRLLLLRSRTTLQAQHEVVQQQARAADGFANIQLEIVKSFG